MDARRILSPGRVTPIDSDAPDLTASVVAETESEPESLDPLPENRSVTLGRAEGVPGAPSSAPGSDRCLDLRLSLKGRDGRCLALDLIPGVLCESSSFLAEKVLDSRATGASAGWREMEVGDVEDLDVLRETIELMYVKDMMQQIMKGGVSPAIGILEVSSNIMFDRGVTSCLNYLEAVPWTESEEEKLKSLFERCTFDSTASQDVLARLGPKDSANSVGLAVRLIQSVTNGANGNARKEMQSLVTGLLSKSSVCDKDSAGLNKENLYEICESCLSALVQLFEEASSSPPRNRVSTRETKPLVERISKQVENLTWLLEILVDKHLGEDFVSFWAEQEGLIKMLASSSPMVRYELSRVSASIFFALGQGKLQCRGRVRFAVLRAWFKPMMVDFGWLQRCSKGLDMKVMEENLGQAVLTLTLKQQQSLFEEWFQCFARQGTESPNLSRAFQVWWIRSFVGSTAFCLRRVSGFHGDGERVVRAYVCENGHVMGAWTERQIGLLASRRSPSSAPSAAGADSTSAVVSSPPLRPDSPPSGPAGALQEAWNCWGWGSRLPRATV